MASLFRLLSLKWNPPRDPTSSFTGRTIIVTGANTGIGYEAALKFASLGAAKVILGVRSLPSGTEAKAAIERLTGRRNCIELWHLDMLDYSSIRAFAQRADDELDALDVAVLNAGVFMPKYEIAATGWEKTLQVNTLSTVLLSLLLLPKLRASASLPASSTQAGSAATSTPTLELVSSGTHRRITLSDNEAAAEKPLELFNQPEGYRAGKQYGVSKLFLMCALHHLARLGVNANGKVEVTVTSVCPGPTKSGLGRGYMHWYLKPLFALFSFLFMRTTEAGARTLVSGVALGIKSHGQFWQHDEFQPQAPLLEGPEGEERRERVWHEIIDVLRKDEPAVMQLVRPTV